MNNEQAPNLDAQIANLEHSIGKRFTDRVLNLDPRCFRTMQEHEVRVLALWAERYTKRYAERLALLRREIARRGAHQEVSA